MESHQEYGLNSLQRLKSLCQMLRDDADRILSGDMGITISSQTLYELNGALDNLQDGLSPPHINPVTGQLGGQGSEVTGHAGGQRSRVTDNAGGWGSELEEWNFHLQLVLDIVAEAPVLVLYKEKQNGTPASARPDTALQPIRLGYFTSLVHLEISFLPIRAIQDLLKMRERLETLVVINCFADNFHLQDVLEMCDQEVSVPMQWTALRTLCARCNSLKELDGSLRLCPRLDTLDLSRNRLVTTDVYLGYLMELSYIDLSYNDLNTMPSFSATAKKKIRVLLLAGNKLVDIRGVEEMTNLEELDVSENLIRCHNSLAPIRTLHRLDKLNMTACPASIWKDHRLRALQHISTVSLSRKFSLDGRLATHKEIQNSRALLDHYNHQHFSNPVPYNRRQSQPITSADLMTSHSSRLQQEGGSAISEDTEVMVISTRPKKGRKKAKARTLDIPDMDTSTGGELSSRDVTPSTTPKMPSRMEALAHTRRLEVQEKRAEMENLRSYYGNNWLQAVEDKEVIPRPASIVGMASLAGAGGEATTQQQHQSSSQKPSFSGKQENTDKKQTVTAKVDVHLPPDSDRTCDDRVGEHESLGEDRGQKTMSAKVDAHASAQSRDNVSKNVLSSGESGRDSSPEIGTFHRETMFSNSAAEDSGADVASSLPSRSHLRVQQNGSVRCDEGDESRLTEETLLSENGEETVSGERWNKKAGEVNEGSVTSSATNSSTLEAVAEPEDQSEPFIVTLPGDPDHHLIVTVSPRYLVEKDINGVIQDQLDLQSLEAVRVDVLETVDRSEGTDHDFSDLDVKEIRVSLDFSYVRKDRRCREYVMEDIIIAQHFRELVQPFVDARVEAAMKKLHVQHQCLKCSCTFSRAQARTMVHSNMPSRGSSKDFSSLADKGGEKVVLQCPKCSSDHVVQLESGTEDGTATNSTHRLSEAGGRSLHRHRPSFDQLIGAPPPIAHSTPLKHNASTSDVPSVAALSRRRGSKPSSFRSLFSKDDQDCKQRGDGPNPNPTFVVGSPDSASMKQEATMEQEEEYEHDNHHQHHPLQQAFFSSATPPPQDRRSTATSSPSLPPSSSPPPPPPSTSPSSSTAAAPPVVTDARSVVVKGESEGAGEVTGYFNRLDHRLALYLMMTVFTNDEEFRFKIKGCVSQYMMANEYEALVVATTLKLYILRINTEDPSVELAEALTLMEAQPHAELKRVDLGLGNQTLRLEYGSDCSSYTLVLRDEDKLDAVKELLSDLLQSYAMETEVPISTVFTEDADQLTMDNLTRDVLTRGSSTDSLLLYTLGYIARGHNPLYPVAFVVSSLEVSLVNTNHQWPSPHLQAPVTVDTVGKQFTVLERQTINNIATLEIHEEEHRRLRITFFNETSGDETQWLVTMETDKGVWRMVEALRQPWEEAFGVKMDVDYSPFPTTF